ncbi:potassium/proton antiporter [Paenibacillus wulumuqiensis]|uniref:potassium/proton antiporter n=1 Tax=Paenibacillus wulumuqiensis TaxID=1567107 RepID=UPI000619D1E9|nr:potassium/proton antiporter [Paenibacillus wulumuqiensis]
MQAIDLTSNLILLLGTLLLLGVLSTKFSSRFGMPALVFFIVAGMILGRFIYYDNAFITQWFGVLALVIILFEGGMQTDMKLIKPVIRPALSLATIGVLLTAFIIGYFAHLILGVSLLEGMLFGSIVGSTDAAAVFSVLGNKNVRKKLTSTLEVESGSNDPMAVFLTLMFIELLNNPETSVWGEILSFVWEMGFGLVLGIICGKLAVFLINKIDFETSSLYPVLAVSSALFTYGVSSLTHASGFLGVYVMALVMGNSDLTYRRTILQFNQGFGWIMQILMFVLLGLLVFTDQLISIIWQGLALSLLLIIVARPVGVLLSLLFSQFSFREKTLLSWAGLRGAVPIVLATYPLLAGVEHGQLFFNVVFFIVLTSTLIQGTTIAPLAERLGLTEKVLDQQPSILELVATGRTTSEITHMTLTSRSRMIHRELQEIDLPPSVLITAVLRNEEIVTPRGDTVLLPGDKVYLLGPKAKREDIRRLFTGERVPDSSGAS